MESAPVIAYLVSEYPGVSHTFIYDEVAVLRKLGAQIHTLSINEPRFSKILPVDALSSTFFIKQNLRRHWLGLLFFAVCHTGLVASLVLATYKVSRERDSKRYKFIGYFLLALCLCRWFKRNRVSQVHVHFGNVSATVALILKKAMGLLYSMSVHGPTDFDESRHEFLAVKMQNATFVRFVSEDGMSKGKNLLKVPNSKFFIARCGLSLGQFRYVARSHHLTQYKCLSVGRLEKQKDYELLIHAFSMVVKDMPEARLLILGEGPERAVLERQILQHDLSGFVELKGAVSRNEVSAAHADASLFVSSSAAEGLPVVLMEAAAIGTPIVATAVDGVPELIENRVSGLLVYQRSPEQLAEAIAAMLKNRDLAASCSVKARSIVEEKYSVEKNTAILFEAFVQTASIERRRG